MAQTALFDADGTLYKEYAIFPVYEAFAADGFIPRHDAGRLNEVWASYQNAEVDFFTFVNNTVNLAAAILEGRQLSVASSIAQSFFADKDFAWFGYVEPLLADAKASAVETVLITSEPLFIAQSIASALNMTDYRGSRFGIDANGRCTGEATILIHKGEAAKSILKNGHRSVAFGDSEGDIDMLEVVDQAVGVNPTPILRAYAVSRNWMLIEDPTKPQAFTFKG